MGQPLYSECGMVGASGGYCDVRGGRSGSCGRKGFLGGSKDLMQEKNEKGQVMIEVRPEGHIDEPGSDNAMGGIYEVSSDIQRYTKNGKFYEKENNY